MKTTSILLLTQVMLLNLRHAKLAHLEKQVWQHIYKGFITLQSYLTTYFKLVTSTNEFIEKEGVKNRTFTFFRATKVDEFILIMEEAATQLAIN